MPPAPPLAGPPAAAAASPPAGGTAPAPAAALAPSAAAAAAVAGMRVVAVEPDGLTVAQWGRHTGAPARPAAAALAAFTAAAFDTEGATDYARSGEAMFRFGDPAYVDWMLAGNCEGLLAVGPDGAWRGSLLMLERGLATRGGGAADAAEARHGVFMTGLSVPPGGARRAVAHALARACMTRVLPSFPDYLALAHFDVGGGGARVVLAALSRGNVEAPAAASRRAGAALAPGPGPHGIWATATATSRVWVATTDARKALRYDSVPGGAAGAALVDVALASPLRFLVECARPRPAARGGPALALVDVPHAPDPEPPRRGACADLRCPFTLKAYSSAAAGGPGPGVAGCYRATFEGEAGAPWVEVWYLLLGLGKRGLPDTKISHVQFVVRGPGAAGRHASAALRAVVHALAAAHGAAGTLAHDGGGALPTGWLLRAGFIPTSRTTFALFFGAKAPGGAPVVDSMEPMELELV
ncbi:MAG: hypothetical protein J3K34DRAFT_518282 [Monoraphidium minutum]|nr:MAG: hypothetical protein J3K34DRAFT_518282 [Monoraphidium minutum]